MIAAQIALLLVWGMPLQLMPTPAGTPKQEHQEPAAYHSEPNPSPQSATDTDKECCCGSEQNERENDWIARSAVATALFTAALVGATSALWWAGKKHSERELRAWVTVAGAELKKPLTAGEKFVIIVRLWNSGKTPALRTRVASKAYCAFSPIEEIQELDNQSNAPIGPSCNWHAVVESEQSLESHQIEGVKNRMNAIYVSGKILYRDIFKKPHYTKFCFFISGKDLDSADRKLGAYHEGNVVDEDEA